MDIGNEDNTSRTATTVNTVAYQHNLNDGKNTQLNANNTANNLPITPHHTKANSLFDSHSQQNLNFEIKNKEEFMDTQGNSKVNHDMSISLNSSKIDNPHSEKNFIQTNEHSISNDTLRMTNRSNSN
jgi:hypothetical protein